MKRGLAGQYETIHPFLERNRRVGRLLISLMLFDAGVLGQPLLYLSYYFTQYRDECYRLLNTVRSDGDWEAWLDFFLEGVASTAGSAVDTAHRLLALFRDDDARVRTPGCAASSALRIFDALRDRPLANLKALTERTGASYPTVARAVEALENLGIVHEVTGRKRECVFAYTSYLAILNEGTQPL
jgi:Fic family protein